jgi:O-antigen/teichoic acid export membrane protein
VKVNALRESGFWRMLARLALFGSANGLAQIFSIIYTLMLARWLAPAGYGMWAGSFSIATLALFFVNWGLDTWLLRNAAAHPEPLRLAGAVFRLKLLLGAFWSVGMWLVLSLARPDIYWPTLMAVVLVDTWLDSTANSLNAVLNATRRVRSYSTLLASARGLRLLSAGILMLLRAQDLLAFALIRLVVTAGMTLLAVRVTRPDFRPAPELSPARIWRASLPYGLSELMAVIYGQIDVTLMALLAGSLAAGIYAPALGLANALVILIVSASFFFIPYLSRALPDFTGKFLPLVRRVLLVMLAGGLASAGALALLGNWLALTFLGERYQDSGPILLALSPLLLLKSIGAGCAAVLISAGLQRQRLLPQVLSAGANLLLNLWAIPRWGPLGAAMVYLASEAILTAGYAIRAAIYLRQPRHA